MTCTLATSACACAVPGGTSPRATAITRMVVASTTSHTLTAIRRAAVADGGSVSLHDGLLEVTTEDPDRLLRSFDAALTRPEKAEARVLEVGQDADVSLVALALTAPSIAVRCARLREHRLGDALREGAAFHSVYQPILDLATGATVAFEALLRATLDDEPVLPGPLFAAAEEAGWLHVLDRIGRERAIQGATGWLGDADLFVNFNPTSIYRPEVCLATTERAVRDAGIRMDQLVFEVVESHHIDGMDHLMAVLHHYREMGCRVAMDDLGAGYASLNSLAAIEPEVVKLDKELVQRLPDRAAVAVVRSIVALSHEIGATVIAECVETADQVRVAQDLGVDWAQGWYFARPAPRPLDHPIAPLPPRDLRRASVSDAPVPAGRELDLLLHRAVDATGTGVTLADARQPDMPLVYVNPAFEVMSGYAPTAVLGRNCRFLQGEGTDPEPVAVLHRAIEAGEAAHVRLRNERPDGTSWWNDLSITPLTDECGVLTHYVGIQQDVTALVEAQQRIIHLARHDSLTGLANRAHLLDHIADELQRAERTGRVVAISYLDLDGFKAVNDGFGHAVGDRLLAGVAARLSSMVREEELLARIGGDEFVLVQVEPRATVDLAIARAAADVRRLLGEPFELDGRLLEIGASIGVARSGEGRTDAGRLLDAADAAMYAAKRTEVDPVLG